MIYKYALILALFVPMWSQSASITITIQPDSKWGRVTKVDAAGLDIGSFASCGAAGTTGYCVSAYTRFYIGNPSYYGISCTTATGNYGNQGCRHNASGNMQQFFPRLLNAEINTENIKGQKQGLMDGSNGVSGTWQSNYIKVIFVNAVPPVPTCTVSDLSLTMTGTVGSALYTGGTIWIECDRKADLRLTIANGGNVSIGNNGLVQLTFYGSKGDSFSFSMEGLEPLYIDAVLKRSPSIAGQYSGSAVILMDIL
ncbi:Uncharacterised protein [Yersinia intermedia]|uniref:Exported pilin protein n=1 Tax=Yersinia intermedia TaxID=631 RepID=A0A0H5LWY0_YERIN|nr:Uncharacterised protein [Yersinia intermedia]